MTRGKRVFHKTLLLRNSSWVILHSSPSNQNWSLLVCFCLIYLDADTKVFREGDQSKTQNKNRPLFKRDTSKYEFFYETKQSLDNYILVIFTGKKGPQLPDEKPLIFIKVLLFLVFFSHCNSINAVVYI